MRIALLLSAGLLALSGCVSVDRTPAPTTTTVITPAAPAATATTTTTTRQLSN
jgi:hypothetical protein